MPSRRRASTASAPVSAEKPSEPIRREVPIADILEPLDPDRETFDEAKMQELQDSIARVGLIQDLATVAEGARVRIAAGHRRYLCCKVLGYKAVWCKVWPEGTPIAEAIMGHENEKRADVNPAEKARKYKRLLDGPCGGDIDKLCEMRGEKREYVEDRLLLLAGDAEVFDALEKGQIGMGVAEWLNRDKDPLARKAHLIAAVDSGAGMKVVRQWVIQANELLKYQQNPDGKPPEIPAAVGPAVVQRLVCECCQHGPEDGALQAIYAHRLCWERVWRSFEREIAGTGDGTA